MEEISSDKLSIASENVSVIKYDVNTQNSNKSYLSNPVNSGNSEKTNTEEIADANNDIKSSTSAENKNTEERETSVETGKTGNSLGLEKIQNNLMGMQTVDMAVSKETFDNIRCSDSGDFIKDQEKNIPLIETNSAGSSLESDEIENNKEERRNVDSVTKEGTLDNNQSSTLRDLTKEQQNLSFDSQNVINSDLSENLGGPLSPNIYNSGQTKISENEPNLGNGNRDDEMTSQTRSVNKDMNQVASKTTGTESENVSQVSTTSVLSKVDREKLKQIRIIRGKEPAPGIITPGTTANNLQTNSANNSQTRSSNLQVSTSNPSKTSAKGGSPENLSDDDDVLIVETKPSASGKVGPRMTRTPHVHKLYCPLHPKNIAATKNTSDVAQDDSDIEVIEEVPKAAASNPQSKCKKPNKKNKTSSPVKTKTKKKTSKPSINKANKSPIKQPAAKKSPVVKKTVTSRSKGKLNTVRASAPVGNDNEPADSVQDDHSKNENEHSDSIAAAARAPSFPVMAFDMEVEQEDDYYEPDNGMSPASSSRSNSPEPEAERTENDNANVSDKETSKDSGKSNKELVSKPDDVENSAADKQMSVPKNTHYIKKCAEHEKNKESEKQDKVVSSSSQQPASSKPVSETSETLDTQTEKISVVDDYPYEVINLDEEDMINKISNVSNDTPETQQTNLCLESTIQAPDPIPEQPSLRPTGIVCKATGVYQPLGNNFNSVSQNIVQQQNFKIASGSTSTSSQFVKIVNAGPNKLQTVTAINAQRTYSKVDPVSMSGQTVSSLSSFPKQVATAGKVPLTQIIKIRPEGRTGNFEMNQVSGQRPGNFTSATAVPTSFRQPGAAAQLANTVKTNLFGIHSIRALNQGNLNTGTSKIIPVPVLQRNTDSRIIAGNAQINPISGNIRYPLNQTFSLIPSITASKASEVAHVDPKIIFVNNTETVVGQGKESNATPMYFFVPPVYSNTTLMGTENEIKKEPAYYLAPPVFSKNPTVAPQNEIKTEPVYYLVPPEDSTNVGSSCASKKMNVCAGSNNKLYVQIDTKSGISKEKLIQQVLSQPVFSKFNNTSFVISDKNGNVLLDSAVSNVRNNLSNSSSITGNLPKKPTCTFSYKQNKSCSQEDVTGNQPAANYISNKGNSRMSQKPVTDFSNNLSQNAPARMEDAKGNYTTNLYLRGNLGQLVMNGGIVTVPPPNVPSAHSQRLVVKSNESNNVSKQTKQWTEHARAFPKIAESYTVSNDEFDKYADDDEITIEYDPPPQTIHSKPPPVKKPHQLGGTRIVKPTENFSPFVINIKQEKPDEYFDRYSQNTARDYISVSSKANFLTEKTNTTKLPARKLQQCARKSTAARVTIKSNQHTTPLC